MRMPIRQFGIGFSIILTLVAAACSAKHTVGVPADVLGLTIGMDKSDSTTHLQEIAEFERDERQNQQVWKLKDASRFSAVAIGYNRENKVRYVTAFVDKEQAKEHIKFSDVGDLSKAKAEIVRPHYRYIWEVPSAAGTEPYTMNVYGDNAEFVTIYTIVERSKPGEADETKEDTD